jgi:hypothetical protein
MYGYIDMMEMKPLNMMEELYIDTLRDSVIYCVSAGLHDWAVNDLRMASTGEEKSNAFEALLKVCSAEGCFWEGLNAIDRIISDPEMTTYRAILLFHAGEMNERLYDFDAQPLATTAEALPVLQGQRTCIRRSCLIWVFVSFISKISTVRSNVAVRQSNTAHAHGKHGKTWA